MPKVDSVAVHNWKQHPVTKKLYMLLEEAKRITSESMLNGDFLHSSKPEVNYADAVGFLKGLRFVLDAELATKEEEDNERDVYTRWLEDSN
jgi:hypothetical protein